MRVEVDAAQVDDPGEAGGVVDDDLVGGAPRREREGRDAKPIGPVVGGPLLEEERTTGAVDEALEGHRSPADPDQGAVRDGEVVANQVDLVRARLWEEALVRVRERGLATGRFV